MPSTVLRTVCMKSLYWFSRMNHQRYTRIRAEFLQTNCRFFSVYRFSSKIVKFACGGLIGLIITDAGQDRQQHQ